MLRGTEDLCLFWQASGKYTENLTFLGAMIVTQQLALSPHSN